MVLSPLRFLTHEREHSGRTYLRRCFDLKCLVYYNFLFYSIIFYPISLGGRRGTTDEFATIPFHLDLFSAALVELAKSIPVHSLILSSHLFFCLPLFLFTVPCRIVFAKLKYYNFSCSIQFFVRYVGLLVGCFGLNGPLRQYFSLYRAVSQREGKRK